MIKEELQEMRHVETWAPGLRGRNNCINYVKHLCVRA